MAGQIAKITIRYISSSPINTVLMSGCTRATVTMLLRADDMSIAALSR